MNKKILLDSNILIYALDAANPFHARAKSFVLDVSLDLFVSTKNISEYFTVCSKLGIPFDKTWIFYQSLCQNAQVLFPSEASLAIFETLLCKYQPKGNRVFDLEIVSIALANGIREICTVNTKDFLGVSEVGVLEI